MDTQLELPMKYPTYSEYSIEVRKGPNGEEKVRAHHAESVEDATSLIGGLMSLYAARDEVVWQFDEMQDNGRLYGLAPGGVVWLVEVTPSLTVALTPR